MNLACFNRVSTDAWAIGAEALGAARPHCQAAVALGAHRGGAVLLLLVIRRPMSPSTRNGAFRVSHAFPGPTAVSMDARTRHPDPKRALLNYTITLTTRPSEFVTCCCSKESR
jgi:hypothetical protein